MKGEFKILSDFLERCGPEVSGRSVVQPDPETLEKLDRFVRGEADRRERAELCLKLREHPEWIRQVAEKAKARRGKPKE